MEGQGQQGRPRRRGVNGLWLLTFIALTIPLLHTAFSFALDCPPLFFLPTLITTRLRNPSGLSLRQIDDE